MNIKIIVLVLLTLLGLSVYLLVHYWDTEYSLAQNHHKINKEYAFEKSPEEMGSEKTNAADNANDLTLKEEDLWIENDKEVPVAIYLEEMIDAANKGNANALYQWSTIERNCGSFPESEDQLQNHIKKKLAQANTDNHKAIKQNLIKNFIYCEGYPRGVLGTGGIRNHIMAAARGGNPKAKIEFSSWAFIGINANNIIQKAEEIVALKQEAMQHLVDSRNLGEANALYHLGMAYENGELIGVDFIEAYAHYYAHLLLHPDSAIGTSSYFLEIEQSLSREELESAIARGEAYSRCCN